MKTRSKSLAALLALAIVGSGGGRATAATVKADVSVAMTDSPDPAQVGQDVEYAVTVANAGPAKATQVQLSDTVPASMSPVSATPNQGSCSISGQDVTCALGTVATGASTAVTITVRANSSGSATNQAHVSAAQTDPDTSNNTATQTTTVNAASEPSRGCTATGSFDSNHHYRAVCRFLSSGGGTVRLVAVAYYGPFSHGPVLGDVTSGTSYAECGGGLLVLLVSACQTSLSLPDGPAYVACLADPRLEPWYSDTVVVSCEQV